MRKYKDVLIENIVPKTDNAELYQDETEPKRYQTPEDDIISIRSTEAEKYQDSKEDVFRTYEPHDRIAELLKEQYREDDGGTITTLEDIEKQMIKKGKLSEQEEEIEKADEPKDENEGEAKDNPDEVESEKPMDKDKKETKEVTVDEQEDPEQKEEEEEKTDKEQEEEKEDEDEEEEEKEDEDDTLNEELEQLLSLYEEESKIDPDQEHLTDIPESDDGEDLDDILDDEGDYIQNSTPKKEKIEIPNADSDNPSSSETTGYSDISENEIDAIIDEIFNESYKITFKEDDDAQVPLSKKEMFDENISLFQDSEDFEEAEIVTESSNVDQDEMDTIIETFSDIEKNMLLDALNEDRDIEDLLDEILNEK